MSNRKYLVLLALLLILSCATGSAQPTTTGSPRRTVLYRPGDFDSQFFRIPALITAKDGSLVAACDRRKYSNADLPEDIDILLNRSADGGQAWSGPQFLAMGRGRGQGFGDCALAHTRDEGGLIAVYAGGVGFWQSRPDEPLRIYCRRSTDNGLSWSPAEDITHYLYGPDCADSVRRQWWGGFLRLRQRPAYLHRPHYVRGCLAEGAAWSANDYVLYSDDNGETWQCSKRACKGGDEAKVVELRDGRILMSIRHQGERWFNISAYSSLCLLPDGSIGMYVEEDPKGGDHYEMVFYNFNLEWLDEHLKP